MRNVVICGQEPLLALAAPPRFSVALTADPAYREHATPEIVARLRADGRKVYAWCDCRPWGSGPDSGTPPEEAKRLVSDLGLDGWIGQAERTDEFDYALGAGAEVVVVNANSWTQEQRARAVELIRAGRLALIQETYANVGWPWPEATGTQGVPVASFCLGVYDGAADNPDGGRYIPISEYREHTPAWAWPHVSVYHAAGVRDVAEWGALRVPVFVEEPERNDAMPTPIKLPKLFTPTHQTGGLPGYPAVDVFAAPGTVVLAPEYGKIDRLSGKDPSVGGSPGGSYGWTIYLLSLSGRYFLTHFGSRRPLSVGDYVTEGQPLGTVCDSAVSGKPGTSHIHVGKNTSIRLPKPADPKRLAALRRWILARVLVDKWSWARVFRTFNWREFKRLGGK